MKIAGMTLLAASLAVLPTVAMSHDYSTPTRVHYVMDCLTANPSMNVYEGVYKCSCVVDELAEQFTETEFEDVDTAFMYQNLPADRGATFRDNKLINKEMKFFQKAQIEAYKSCRLR